MKEQVPPIQTSRATKADRVAENLARLREAQSNLADQGLIAERIAERQETLQAQIDRAQHVVERLKADWHDETAHRKLVEGVLREKLRLARLPFEIPVSQDKQIGS
ncbi:hypothetical protein HYW36_00585 [Candidatus Saccharibacteria bacterium]|nr:hypothetical protein [Candidatus Saccharibacteria bacterium]